MQDEKILAALQNLYNSSSWESHSNETEKYPIEKLESLAVKMYEKNFRNYRKGREVLYDILRRRFYKTREAFVWNDTTRKTFLEINGRLASAFETAYTKAMLFARELERKIKNGGAGFNDYEIEVRIMPRWNERFYDSDNAFAYVLAEPLFRFCPITYSISHSVFDRCVEHPPINLDKSENWNRDYLGDTFKDEKIGREIYQLLSHGWTFEDILKIEDIHTDIEVIYQSSEKV